jgi:hypothetical protein
MHIREAESFFERCLSIGDAKSIVGDLKNQVCRIARNGNAYERRLCMPHRVAYRFLSNSEEILLDGLRQTLFGHTSGIEITLQSAWYIRAFDHFLQCGN